MKKLITSVIFLAFVLAGCAGNDSYVRYLDAKRHQVSAERKPLVDLTLDSNSRVSNIKFYPQPPMILIEQEKDHPGYALAGGVVRVLGVVGSIFVAGEAIEGIVEASTGNSTNMNSYNNNSENSGTIDAMTDYSDAKSDVFTTDVETSQEGR